MPPATPAGAAGERETEASSDPSADDETLFLDEVVVTGTRRPERVADQPVATEVLTREEIERSGTETLAELLEEQPGMDVFDGRRGQGLRMRGLEPEHTLFLIDGERVPGRMDGVLDLSRWQLDDIERVEIVRGAASALYGSDALGGVINIIPRRGAGGWEAEGRFTWGARDSRRDNRRDRFEGGPRPDGAPRDAFGDTLDTTLRLGWGGERGGVSLFGGHHRIDGWDLDPSNAATNGSDTESWTGGARAWWKPGARSTLRLRADWSRLDAATRETRGRVVVMRRSRTEQSGASFGAEHRTRRGTLTLRASYTRFRDQFLRQVQGGSALAPQTETLEQLGQLQGRYLHVFSDAHILTVGYDTFLESLGSDRLERTDRRARLAPYVQHEWTPSEAPAVTLVPGVRVDADSLFGAAVSPKLALRVDPTDALVLRASGGRGFRAPSFRELLLQFDDNAALGYVVEGNPDLRPESSWSVDGGFEWRAHRRAWLNATAFYSRIDDLIGTDVLRENDGVATFGYVNVAEARTRGVELQARLRPVHQGPHRVRVELGYSFLDADDLGQGRALPGRARHRATFQARYRQRELGFDLLWRSQLVGARPFYVDGERIEAEPYLSLDLRLEQAIGDHLRAFLGADNVLNNGGTYLNVQPRTFWFGLAARR